MKIIKETDSYNARRYGRPWIARVVFSQSAKGEFVWGDWTGDHYNGGEGILSIEANLGDIIAIGQKDHRNSKRSAPDFYVVMAAGELEEIGDKGAAYKYYLTIIDQEWNQEVLRTEKEKLLARIAEIDKMMGVGK